jgi:quinol monooxygenase YgiN
VITFVTHTRVEAANAAAFEALLQEMCAKVAAHEPGVLHYGYGRSVDDPEVFMVVEVFRDEAARDVHAGMPFLAEIMPKAAALAKAGAFDVKRYEAP